MPFDQKKYNVEYKKKKYSETRVYFSKEEKEEISEYCDSLHKSLSAFIKEVVLQYIRSHPHDK